MTAHLAAHLAVEAPGQPSQGPRVLSAVPNPQAGVCQHQLWDAPDGLRCARPTGHSDGHVYLDSSGSSVNDRHADGGHG
ncbi:hypothetical protein [Nocardioides limicola]|uniref:hypothetical protein n=1 Tax=Nocardioides limicola TaxID=2803368 RepID=UPI00193B44E3|nr:hypothetical protein [Nocardioides sp. DJM-14]